MTMATKNEGAGKKTMNKGAWTAEEDQKLAQYIEVHGARRWKTIAIKAGLNRCGKSCRLRWLNYLRPNIKRGNISDDEEELILRLHKLLGNRWSLIAGRLPGRTDNEIKNYWNSHLSKKINNEKEKVTGSTTTSTLKEQTVMNRIDPDQSKTCKIINADAEEDDNGADKLLASTGNLDMNFDVNEFFDFSTEASPGTLEWVNKFLELEDHDQDPNVLIDQEIKDVV